MIFGIDLIRALAILLITNSHLDALYPNPVMATGGMFGNEMFFLISGYGLALSLSRDRKPFWSWLRKREWRVAEPLIVATTLMIAIGFFEFSSVGELLLLYTGIDHYWFLPIIMIFYIPLYFIMTAERGLLAVGFSVAIALGFYSYAYFNLISLDTFDIEAKVASKAPFYFLIMLLGVWLARNGRRVTTRWWDFAALVAATLAYLVFRFAMVRYDWFEAQFVVHVIGLCWIYAMYRCAMDKRLEILGHGISGRVVAFLSANALQIYLLQEFFYSNAVVTALAFPLNIAFFAITVLPAAWLLKKANLENTKKAYSALRSS